LFLELSIPFYSLFVKSAKIGAKRVLKTQPHSGSGAGLCFLLYDFERADLGITYDAARNGTTTLPRPSLAAISLEVVSAARFTGSSDKWAYRCVVAKLV
jgi:hypothetical protein